jgi:hypothetical protein
VLSGSLAFSSTIIPFFALDDRRKGVLLWFLKVMLLRDFSQLSEKSCLESVSEKAIVKRSDNSLRVIAGFRLVVKDFGQRFLHPFARDALGVFNLGKHVSL